MVIFLLSYCSSYFLENWLFVTKSFMIFNRKIKFTELLMALDRQRMKANAIVMYREAKCITV